MRCWIMAVLSFSTAGYAGIAVQGKYHQGDRVSPVKQYYDGVNARLEFESTPGSQMGLLYRGTNKTVALIDHQKKSYLEASEADLARIASLLSAFKGRKEGNDAPPKLSFKKEKGVQSVGSWKCTRYSVLNHGKKEGTLCVVPLERVGATPQDLSPLVSMAKSVSSLGLVPADQRGYLDMIEPALKLGFLVQSEGYDKKGRTISQLVVESAKTETFASEVFGTPQGYERKDLTSLLKNPWIPPSGK
jgi:hypothetical protein